MRFSAAFLLVLAIFFWSTNYVLGRLVVGTVPPLTLAYVRWLVAVLLFFPFCRRELALHRNEIKANWMWFVCFGMTGLLGFNFFQYEAVKYSTAINATIINSSTPMFIAIFSFLIFGSRLEMRQIAGIFCSFLGVIAIIAQGDPVRLLEFSFNKGDLLMLAAVLVNTAYYLTLKRKGYIIPQKSLLFLSALGGLLATLPVPVVENMVVGTEWLSALRPVHYILLVYFSIFPSILAISFLNRAIVELGPVKTAVFQNLGIVFSSILGIVILDEKLLFTHIVGGGLIFLGVWLNSAAGAVKSGSGSESSISR